MDETEGSFFLGLVRIQAERYHKATGASEREVRYYITSLKPDAARLNAAIRQHWGIENKLHWVLDVGFGEDLSRKRAGRAAQKLFHPHPHRPQHAQPGQNLQHWASTVNACKLLGTTNICSDYAESKFRCVCPGQALGSP